jgi:alcohol dehydrogenase (cytochrome c)
MTIRRTAAALGAALLGCVSASGQDGRADRLAGLTPIDDAALLDPDPADWLMWRRTLDAWGYSPLDQIRRRNVERLALVWSRGLPEGSNQGTPLVHDGVMFFPAPNDTTQAFDAATGDFLWEYRRPWPDDLRDYIPAADTNRNLAVYGELIIDAGNDNYLYALNARTGALVWETQYLDYRTGSKHSSGPIVAEGRVFSTGGCEPEGGPDACVILAHDAATGEELWRTRTIAGPGEPGDETWGDVPFERRVHAGAWMVPSYDPELGLLFVGTSVTAPAPKYMLGGNDKQHLYHNSTLALDAATGAIVWHYQHVVDHWDLDHPFERLLIDVEVAPDPDEVPWINPNVRPGERRRVVTGVPGKTGLVYTLDRTTGEFLWARPTVPQNIVSDIDGATGAVTVNPDVVFEEDGDQVDACPSGQGGKNWPAGTYSPETGLMYMPMLETCTALTSITPISDDIGLVYGIRFRSRATDPDADVGAIYAVSAETGELAWRFVQRAGTLSLLATGGRLVFGGDGAGRFRAFDDRNGDILWEVSLGSPVTGYPVTYSVDGRQYVAVSTSFWGASVVTPEIRVANANTLYVFALP